MKKAILMIAAAAALGAQAEDVYDFQFQKAPEAKIDKPAASEGSQATPTTAPSVSAKQEAGEEETPDRRTRVALFGAWSTMDDATGKETHGANFGFQWMPLSFFGLNADVTLPVEESKNKSGVYGENNTHAPVEAAAGIILTPLRLTVAGRDLISLSGVAGGMTYQAYDFPLDSPQTEYMGRTYHTRLGLYGGGALAINPIRNFGIFGQYRWVLNDPYMRPGQLTAGMALRF